MAKLEFDRTGVERLMAHAKSCDSWNVPYGTPENQGKPQLMLVKDDGIYLMSNGIGQDDGREPVYAKGYEPGSEDLWDRCRDAVGGDDFAEYIALTDLEPIPFVAKKLIVNMRADTFTVVWDQLDLPKVPTGLFRVGDTVVVNHPKYPGKWTITKINPKNLKLSPVGGGRGLNAPKTMCTKVDPDATLPETTVALVERRTPYSPGQFVRFTGTWNQLKTNTVMVVIADKGDRVNCARLGGDGHGGYFRIGPRNLEAVPNQDVIFDDFPI